MTATIVAQLWLSHLQVFFSRLFRVLRTWSFCCRDTPNHLGLGTLGITCSSSMTRIWNGNEEWIDLLCSIIFVKSSSTSPTTPPLFATAPHRHHAAPPLRFSSKAANSLSSSGGGVVASTSKKPDHRRRPSVSTFRPVRPSGPAQMLRSAMCGSGPESPAAVPVSTSRPYIRPWKGLWCFRS